MVPGDLLGKSQRRGRSKTVSGREWVGAGGPSQGRDTGKNVWRQCLREAVLNTGKRSSEEGHDTAGGAPGEGAGSPETFTWPGQCQHASPGEVTSERHAQAGARLGKDRGETTVHPQVMAGSEGLGTGVPPGGVKGPGLGLRCLRSAATTPSSQGLRTLLLQGGRGSGRRRNLVQEQANAGA